MARKYAYDQRYNIVFALKSNRYRFGQARPSTAEAGRLSIFAQTSGELTAAIQTKSPVGVAMRESSHWQSWRSACTGPGTMPRMRNGNAWTSAAAWLVSRQQHSVAH